MKRLYPDLRSNEKSSILNSSVHMNFCNSHILRLVRWPRLAHQADLGGEASSPSVLQKPRHCVVVQVIDEVPNSRLVGRSQFILRQRRQRGTGGLGSIVIKGRNEGQLRLEETEKWLDRRAREGKLLSWESYVQSGNLILIPPVWNVHAPLPPKGKMWLVLY